MSTFMSDYFPNLNMVLGRSRTAALFLALGTLLAGTMNAAETTNATVSAAQEIESTEDSAPAGMLPVPDYSGNWATRPNLTGTWGGVRQDWANKGVTFDVQWFQVGQGIASGGLDQRATYISNLDYFLNLDLSQMGAIPGALVAFRAQSRFGETVNADTGLLLPVNTYSYFPLTGTLDEDVPFTITELNYVQFFSEKLGANVGKITTMRIGNEFAGGEGRSQFMNFQLAWSAVLAQLVPYSTLAVSGFWLPSPRVSVTGTLMNTTDSSTTTGFLDIGEGATAVLGFDVQHRLGGVPGGNTFTGAYGFDGDYARVGGLNIGGGDISVDTRSESYALFWSGWQYFWLEADGPEMVDPTDGRQDLQGLGLFAMVGWGDRKTNPVSWSIAGGLSGRGTIPTRDNDTWGIGYFYNDLQSLDSFLGSLLEPSVQGFEFYYNIAVAESIALTFDVQVADSALPNVDNSVALAGRLNIRL